MASARLPVAGLVESGGGGGRGRRRGRRARARARAAASGGGPRGGGTSRGSFREPAGGRAAWGWAGPAGRLLAGEVVTTIMRRFRCSGDGGRHTLERGQHAPSLRVRRRRFGGRRPQLFSGRPVARSTRGQTVCSARAAQAGPDPPARRQRARRAARRVAGCARCAVRGRPHVGRAVGARSGATTRGSPRSATTAWPATCTTPAVAAERELLDARGRARRAGARASVTAARCSRRCSAPRSGRRRWRSSAGARSRPMTPSSCRRGRGSSGTSSASARRRARPSSRAPPTRRRRSGSARTSASSSTPRRRWRSSTGGRARTGSRPSRPRRPSSSPPPGTRPSASSTASSPPRGTRAPPPPSRPIRQHHLPSGG